jgi:hypothetical protein
MSFIQVDNATFRGRLPIDKTPIAYLIDRIGREHPNPGKYFVMPTNEYHADISKAQLSTRGWCEQERVLSPRILHFTSNQVYWDCYESMANEVWPKGHPTWHRLWDVRPCTILQDLALHHGGFLADRDITANIKSAVGDPIMSWYRLAYNYARTELSFRRDRLVAIGGLARAMQPYLNTDPADYLAGVWRQSLPYGLLWSARWVGRKSGKRVREDILDPKLDYQAPSWSWASVNWGTTVEAWHTDQSPHEAVADIESDHIDLVSEDNPFGRVEPSSRITLEAHTFKISLTWVVSRTNYKGSKYWPELHLGLTKFVNEYGNVICPDEMYIEDYTRDRNDLIIVPVMRSTADNKQRWIKALMLEPTENEGVYRRFGYVHLIGNDVKWFNLSTGNTWGLGMMTKDKQLITII